MTMTRPKQHQILKAALKKIGMSQAELARQLELPQPQINRMVNGHQALTYDKIPTVAKILNLDPDVLYVTGNQLPPDIAPAILDHPKLIQVIRKHRMLMAMNHVEKGLNRRDIAGTIDRTTSST
jgi:plasmid maintenance system antidote protein VapI